VYLHGSTQKGGITKHPGFQYGEKKGGGSEANKELGQEERLSIQMGGGRTLGLSLTGSGKKRWVRRAPKKKKRRSKKILRLKNPQSPLRWGGKMEAGVRRREGKRK